MLTTPPPGDIAHRRSPAPPATGVPFSGASRRIGLASDGRRSTMQNGDVVRRIRGSLNPASCEQPCEFGWCPLPSVQLHHHGDIGEVVHRNHVRRDLLEEALDHEQPARLAPDQQRHLGEPSINRRRRDLPSIASRPWSLLMLPHAALPAADADLDRARGCDTRPRTLTGAAGAPSSKRRTRTARQPITPTRYHSLGPRTPRLRPCVPDSPARFHADPPSSSLA